MGKVLKAVAVIAVAAAIAYFAPTLGLAALPALGSTAVAGSFAATLATAVVATALGTAASLAYRALSGPPSATVTLAGASLRTPVESETVAPRGAGGWRNPIFMPAWRFSIEGMTGDCMEPVASAGWAIVDRVATVRAGDLIVIRVGDQRRYYAPRLIGAGIRRLIWAATNSPMCKRFRGVGGGVLMFEHTNPPRYLETDDAGVDVLYRIRAVEPSLWRAVRTWRQMRCDPDAFDQRVATPAG